MRLQFLLSLAALTWLPVRTKSCVQDIRKEKRIRVREIQADLLFAREFFFIAIFYSFPVFSWPEFLVFLTHNVRDPNIRDSWLLVGIVSFGLGCARPGELGAYTNVAYYLKWIDEVMGMLQLILGLMSSFFTLKLFLGEKTVQSKRIPRQSCSGLICPRGTGACLTPDLICDEIVDCLNAEDELSCTTKLLPTSHKPIVTTVSPNLNTTPLPRPTVCSVDQFMCSK